MNRTIAFGTLLAALLAPAAAMAKVQVQPVEYKQGDATLEGAFAWDDAVKGPRPAVIVVHEWKGPGPYSRRRTEMIAALGYVGFEADIYGKGVRPTSHEDAGKISGVYRSDRALLRARILAALDTVKKNPNVDPKRIAAIGYCFGGTTVLELARSGADVVGVASFHGGLDTPTPAKKGDIKAKVLVLQGGADSFTLPGLPGLEKELTDAGADWEVDTYAGAVHSFTVKEAGNDASSGMAYDEEADRRSWSRLQSFLGEVFGIEKAQ